jgi:hypothetical protein
MIYQYAVTLRNTSSRYVDRISLWLLLISVVLLLREQFTYFNKIQFVLLACTLLIAGIGTRNFMLQKKHPSLVVYYRLALYIAAFGTLFSAVNNPAPSTHLPFQAWLSIPLVLLGLLERQAKMPLEIGFTNDVVVINTLFRRYYRWTDFNNIILKDDILTLDFKSNRLLQRETADEEGDAGEDEFNDYCREQLAKAHSALS